METRLSGVYSLMDLYTFDALNRLQRRSSRSSSQSSIKWSQTKNSQSLSVLDRSFQPSFSAMTPMFLYLFTCCIVKLMGMSLLLRISWASSHNSDGFMSKQQEKLAQFKKSSLADREGGSWLRRSWGSIAARIRSSSRLLSLVKSAWTPIWTKKRAIKACTMAFLFPVTERDLWVSVSALEDFQGSD